MARSQVRQFVFGLSLWLPALCSAGALTLVPKHGPPTGQAAVSGQFFSPNETVDIYFDHTEAARTTAIPSGSFFNVPVTVPASALPGAHYITARGEVSGISAQSKFLVSSDWPQFGYGPDRSGDDTVENVVGVGNASHLSLLWTAATLAGISASPAVVDGVVYVGSTDANVYAFRAGTGQQLWSFPTGGPVTSSAAVAGGLVFVGSGDGYLYALSAASGKVRWKAAQSIAISSSPAVTGGVVYVTGGDGYVWAYRAQNGQPLWQTPYKLGFLSSPATANGLVYVYGGTVTALDQGTGATVWSNLLAPSAFSTPVFGDSLVFVTDYAFVYALDANTGATVWMQSGSFYGGRLAYANGVLYLFGSGVVALNAATGNPIWSVTTDITSLSIANGLLIGGSGDQKLYVLNASDGSTLFSYTIGFSSPAAVSDGRIYIGSSDGNLRAFGFAQPVADPQPPDLKSLN